MNKRSAAVLAIALAACLLIAFEALLVESRMRMGIESLAGTMNESSPEAVDAFTGALIGSSPSASSAEAGRSALAERGYSSLPVDHFIGRVFSDGLAYAIIAGVMLLALSAVLLLILERRNRIRYKDELARRISAALKGEAFNPQNEDERVLKKLLDEIERVNAVREDSAGEMREYVENVAHEIKSPTSGILLNLDLIERGGVTEGKLSSARKCAKRIETYVSGLLTLARLRAEKVRMSYELTDLNELVRETAAELQANGIETEITGETAEVNCDSVRVGEALRNLIVNASKHQEQGIPVKVELSYDENSAYVSVIDKGPGMKEEALIERYSVGNEDGTSFGIGLSLAREVAQRHSGKLTVKKPEIGSEIELTLPRFNLKTSI